MNKYTWRDGSGREFERISRSAARKLYDDYKTVVFCPCNLRPGPPWSPEAYLNKGVNGNDFQIIENALVTAAEDVRRALTAYLKRRGIAFKPNRTIIYDDGSIIEIQDRKTKEPLFAAIPNF